MGTFLEDKDRNVIPRLRSFRTTLALGELDSVGVPQTTVPLDANQSLQSKIRAWQKHRTISFAADLVCAAFVLRQPHEAEQAAQFILSHDLEAPDAAKTIAEKVLKLGAGDEQQQLVLPSVSLPHPDEIYKRIHSVRRQLRDEPRNAILWVELSRAFAYAGVEDKAEHAMDIAVTLGPTNRFVLRSASRLYIHVGRIRKAHNVLRRAESTKYDPWLLSAEIAAGSAANRTSQFVRSGEQMLANESIALFQKNELASAIATLELSHGKIKRARNLFRQALSDPTENSVAQADWALRKKHMEALDLDLERARDATPRSFEANAWNHFTAKEWKPALKSSFDWLRDQPFSKRPVLFGSYIAASLLEDYRDCERIVEIGLRANPDEPILLNNLAFVFASSGEIDKAEEKFRRIKYSNIRDESEQIAITATQGLLFFRRGQANEGRLFYRHAIEEAKRRGFKKSSAIASIYLAREETLSETKYAENAVEQAIEESKKIRDPDVKEVLKMALNIDEAQRHDDQHGNESK